MPNAYVKGIATGQASNSYAPQTGYDPNKPWTTPTWDPAKSNQIGYDRLLDSTRAIGTHDSGTGDYWTNGANGLGWYKAPSYGQQALGAQQYYTQRFNQNMPAMQSQMQGQLAGTINAQADKSIQAARSGNAARGLLYGGINAGQEGAIRANAATNIASGKSQINQGLLQEQSQLNSSAINAGLNFQQVQQQVQDSIYQNAVSGLMTDTALSNGLLKTVGSVGGLIGGSSGGAAAAAAA